MSDSRFTIVIQWSDEDQAYVASLPEWGPSCKTHGATYEEAARNARELLEMLIDTHDPKVQGPLPEPRLFHYPGADVVDLPPDSEATKEPISMAVQR